MATLSPTLNIMMKAAEKAARALVRDFGEVEQLQVSRKGPADFVTAADKRSEEIIFEELKKARPSYSFLMEESGKVEGDSEHTWIVDPIDGTHNFMHGIPHWSISIALEVKGEVHMGLVYDPIKDEMFYAEKGSGAFVSRKRLRVSGRSDMEQCVIAHGAHPVEPKARALFYKEMQAVNDQTTMLRRSASAALDLCYVAAGRFEGYWERGIKAWDVAAGILIVKEAGGITTSIDNNDNPVYSGNIVSANGQIQNSLRQTIKKAGA